jgi:proteasome lid subunit RPN8/RPN11
LTYPEECCGLLSGRKGATNRKIAARSMRMDNVFERQERYHRYAIDPLKYLQVEREAMTRNEEIVGVYHSHPDSSAKPSAYDTTRAWPILSYVVLAVNFSDPIETKSWVLKDDKSGFIPEEIEIEKG